MKEAIVTVDLGGTLIRTARMNREGHIFGARPRAHPRRTRSRLTLPHVIDAIRRVVPDAKEDLPQSASASRAPSTRGTANHQPDQHPRLAECCPFATS